MGRHKLFTHGIKGVSSAAKARERAKARNSEVQPEQTEPEKPQKRAYTKRSVATVNYCPGCGCNLHAVAVAMTLRS